MVIRSVSMLWRANSSTRSRCRKPTHENPVLRAANATCGMQLLKSSMGRPSQSKLPIARRSRPLPSKRSRSNSIRRYTPNYRKPTTTKTTKTHSGGSKIQSAKPLTARLIVWPVITSAANMPASNGSIGNGRQLTESATVTSPLLARTFRRRGPYRTKDGRNITLAVWQS